MEEFLDSPKTKEFIETITIRESAKGEISPVGDFQVVIKGKKRTLKEGGSSPASVWMHPLLFIDFAMWINPVFKYDVIKFLYDELIKFRHGAGDMYVGLSKAVSRFRNVDYPLVGKALNYVVFGRHEAGIRNAATPEQLKELEDLQKNLAFVIDMGVVKNFEAFICQLRALYNKKWNPIKSLAS